MHNLITRMKECQRCNLRSGCNQVVPGHGTYPSQIMLVGEAPGADEDMKGVPFCGASGKLLDRMLKSADIDKLSIWTTNTCRCRPPGNRTPEPDEINTCKSWLWEEIQLVDPLVIVALGGTAAKLLLKGDSKFRITKEVGVPKAAGFLKQGGIVVPMFHPSYLLQHDMKSLEDMVKVFIKVKRYTENHEIR